MRGSSIVFQRTSLESAPFATLSAVGLAIAIYWHNAVDVVRLWTGDNPEYSHGLLLVLVATGLTVRRWLREKPELRCSWFGTASIITLAGVWAASHSFEVMTGERLAFALMPLAIMWSTLGLRAVWQVGLPMALVVFAIPVWSFLNPLLRPMTAHTVSFLIDLVGIPSVAEVTRVLIPVGTFEIAENCTGLRQLVVAMPLALIFSEIMRLRTWYAIALLGAAIVLSFVLNTIRIFIVVLSGQLTNMQHYFVTEDHVGLGWMIFAVGIAGFFFLAGRLIPESGYSPPETSAARPCSDPIMIPPRLLLTRLGAVTLALAIGPFLVQLSILRVS